MIDFMLLEIGKILIGKSEQSVQMSFTAIYQLIITKRITVIAIDLRVHIILKCTSLDIIN